MGWFRRLFGRRGDERTTSEGGTPLTIRAGRARAVGIPYALPKDLEEMNRLDFQHYLLRYALKGNYAAPVVNPQSILDVGTGSGRWAREMAQYFPQANVIGLDINRPPAEDAIESGQTPEIRPDNYSFVAGNVLEGLPFPDASFDFVHMRLLVAGIPHDRWPGVIKELARVTQPGGWVESVESPSLQRGGPATERIIQWIRDLSARREVDITDATRVADLFAPAGLVNTVVQQVDLPCGEYGGRIGRMVAADSFSGINAVGGLFVNLGITTQAEFDQTIEAAKSEMASPQNRCVFPFYIVYGQRPAR